MITPEIIREHKYGNLLSMIYREVHYNDGIVTILFCGKRGKGKSFSMMEWARNLDRSPEGLETRFRPEDVRLDPVDFFRDLTGKYPFGKVICLDDAGLHMYKSDALTDLLKRVSKVLQNIRYKHPIIMLSLPYFGQLMKDARDMTDIYIEMQGIDRKNKVARGHIQTLKISPFTTDIYRYTIMQSENLTHPKFRLDYVHWLPKPYFFNKPPADFIAGYEAIKTPALNRINEEHLQAIAAQRDAEMGRDKPVKMDFGQKLEFAKEHMKDIVVNGKIEHTKLLLLKKDGRCVFGRDDARQIRSELLLQEGVE